MSILTRPLNADTNDARRARTAAAVAELMPLLDTFEREPVPGLPLNMQPRSVVSALVSLRRAGLLAAWSCWRTDGVVYFAWSRNTRAELTPEAFDMRPSDEDAGWLYLDTPAGAL